MMFLAATLSLWFIGQVGIGYQLAIMPIYLLFLLCWLPGCHCFPGCHYFYFVCGQVACFPDNIWFILCLILQRFVKYVNHKAKLAERKDIWLIFQTEEEEDFSSASTE
jgi:hypothetical protein